MREDPDVKPILTAMENQDFDGAKNLWILISSVIIHQMKKYRNLLINELLKQRGLCETIFAMASFNMASEHNFYTAGNHTIHYIDLPILHLVGVNDILTPRDMVLDNYYALLKNSSLIEYTEFGHSLLYQLPREIAKHIDLFIKKII